MWLLDPDGTFDFTLPHSKGVSFRLRQLTISERHAIEPLGKDRMDERMVAILRLGIVGATGLKDSTGAPVSLEFAEAEFAGLKRQCVSAEFVRRIPSRWSDRMSLAIANGPAESEDEGN